MRANLHDLLENKSFAVHRNTVVCYDTNPKCLPEIMCKRGVLGNAPSSGVNVVSAFHKLLNLHVKSSQWFLVPSDINY